MVDQTGAYAYNSWWQFRADSWSRLEEATGRIVTALRRTKPVDKQHDRCRACAVRSIGASGAVLGVSWPRGLWRRPGARGGWSLGTAGPAGGPDQSRARYRVLPHWFLRGHRSR